MTRPQNTPLETGRGRHADSPTEIPPRGWKDVLLRTFKEVSDDRVTLVAAGTTYFLLLALFPTISAIASIYGLFADPAEVREHIAGLAGVIPAGGLQLIDEQLQRLAAQPTRTLGWALLVSVALALWSSSSGVKALFEAMNIAYDEREKRNFFALNATALLFTLGGVVAAGLMLTVVIGIPVALEAVGLGRGFEWVLLLGGYLILAAALMLGVAFLYRFGPSRQQAKWRWISPGAVLAVVIIGTVSGGFSWYASNFAKYDETYGSIGGLIGFLFWIWVSITAIIVGGELNAELEHQTARDSTIGEESPMGQRDATMADTLGESPTRKRESSPATRAHGPRRQSVHRALPFRYALPVVGGLLLLHRYREWRQNVSSQGS